MILGQWFELAAGLTFLFDLAQMSWIISVLNLLPHGNSCSSFWLFFYFSKDQLAGRLLNAPPLPMGDILRGNTAPKSVFYPLDVWKPTDRAQLVTRQEKRCPDLMLLRPAECWNCVPAFFRGAILFVSREARPCSPPAITTDTEKPPPHEQFNLLNFCDLIWPGTREYWTATWLQGGSIHM